MPQIFDTAALRLTQGLPLAGCVFVNFNRHEKMSAEWLVIIMRILHKVEGSVMWMARGEAWSRYHIMAIARDHEVRDDQVVGKHCPYKRQRQCSPTHDQTVQPTPSPWTLNTEPQARSPQKCDEHTHHWIVL
jgi:hypothetical protein